MIGVVDLGLLRNNFVCRYRAELRDTVDIGGLAFAPRHLGVFRKDHGCEPVSLSSSQFTKTLSDPEAYYEYLGDKRNERMRST